MATAPFFLFELRFIKFFFQPLKKMCAMQKITKTMQRENIIEQAGDFHTNEQGRVE